jgi:H+/Cl- antiporter ClcA
MENESLMPIWEQALLGIVAFAILFFFWPGAKKAMEESQQVENPDWKGALIPIAVVVLFVIVLIALASA